MNSYPIRSLISYWEKSLPSTNINRNVIPGFSLEMPNLVSFPENKADLLIELLLSVSHEPAKSSSVLKWDKGWGQNYTDIIQNSICPYIVPYYFGKYPLIRILGKPYLESSYRLPENMINILKPEWDIPADIRWSGAEHTLVRLLMHNIVYIPLLENIKKDKRKDIKIYEFGAGTTHNLFFLKKFMDFYLPDKNISYIAFDWSKSTGKIAKHLGKPFEYNYIDYYQKDTYPSIEEASYIFSLASFEQINTSVIGLLSFIASSNPRLVINIEPIYQSLNKENPMDNQSIEYMKSRNYLPDFISSLLSIKMIKYPSLNLSVMRSGLGSQFLEGYTSVTWNC